MSEATIISLISLLTLVAKTMYDYMNEGRKRKWAIEDRRLAEENKKLTQVGNNLTARSIELVRENTSLTQSGVDHAEMAYREANNVNMKLAQMSTGSVDQINRMEDTGDSTNKMVEDLSRNR